MASEDPLDPLKALLNLREALTEEGFNGMLEAELGAKDAELFKAKLGSDSDEPPDEDEVKDVLTKIGIWGQFLVCVSVISQLNAELGESEVEKRIEKVIPLAEAKELEGKLVDTNELMKNPDRHEILQKFCYMVMGVQHVLQKEGYKPKEPA